MAEFGTAEYARKRQKEKAEQATQAAHAGLSGEPNSQVPVKEHKVASVRRKLRQENEENDNA